MYTNDDVHSGIQTEAFCGAPMAPRFAPLLGSPYQWLTLYRTKVSLRDRTLGF